LCLTGTVAIQFELTKCTRWVDVATDAAESSSSSSEDRFRVRPFREESAPVRFGDSFPSIGLNLVLQNMSLMSYFCEREGKKCQIVTESGAESTVSVESLPRYLEVDFGSILR